MSISLENYRQAAGSESIDELYLIASRVKGRRLQHVNSTSVGGGVAELLTRLVPLLREVGLDVSWDVIKGDQAFFEVTKAFHNALHGADVPIADTMFATFRETTEENLRDFRPSGDVTVIHDPQPAGLVECRDTSGGKWVWRCHIDLSHPDPRVWGFLRPWVRRYDASIFSMPHFAQSLPIPQYWISPSIDPLADKNRELSEPEVTAVLEKRGLDPERPILTQISRFDRLKDPLGVVQAYRLAKRRYPCQLVLAGGGASDDPEGEQVLAEVREAADGDPDIHVLLLPPYSDLEINALVRGSTIVFQKSIREGFGLTVSEALWKRKPVIGGAVGGIRQQVIDGVTGFLVHSPEGAGRRAMQLLGEPKLRDEMGNNGHEQVKQNFLVTRHVKDYLLLILALDYPDEDILEI